jgi:hypothetical protein
MLSVCLLCITYHDSLGIWSSFIDFIYNDNVVNLAQALLSDFGNITNVLWISFVSQDEVCTGLGMKDHLDYQIHISGFLSSCEHESTYFVIIPIPSPHQVGVDR